MPIIVTQIIDFLVSNPWRTACIGLAGIVLTLIILLRVQGFRFDVLKLEKEKLELSIKKLVVDSQIQNEQFKVAAAQLELLKQKQTEDAAKIKKLFDEWPEECNDAAAQALKILKKKPEVKKP